MKLCVVSDSRMPPSLLKTISRGHSYTILPLSYQVLSSFFPVKRNLDSFCDACLIFSQNTSDLFLKNFVRTLHLRAPFLPLFVWLAKSSSFQRAEYLTLGACDCFSGSVCAEELLIKIHGFNHKNPEQNTVIDSSKTVFFHKDFSFSFISKKALYREEEIFLNKKETLLLMCLLQQPERIVPRELLYTQVWENKPLPSSNVLENYISRLRRKIEKRCHIQLIQTVWGVGYRVKRG